MVAQLFCNMAIALVRFLLLGVGSASIQDHCTDISYWDEISYETTTKQCCDTKLKQVCTTKSHQICQDVLELQCEVVAWGECKSIPTSTQSTKCDVKYNDFAHQNCKEVATSIKYIKKVTECEEITKNNCVTDWDLDSNGNKVWGGTETCSPVTWEECHIVEEAVEFPTAKTECHINSQIKWAKFVDATTNIVGLESKCEVKKAVNCKHVVANKCATVGWQECKMEPRQECLAKVIHIPNQKKIHRKKCLSLLGQRFGRSDSPTEEADCYCNGYLNNDGHGECNIDLPYGSKQFWCYVNEGSCSDAVEWLKTGNYWSFEACGVRTPNVSLLLNLLPKPTGEVECYCNGYLDHNGRGECNIDWPIGSKNFWCYVNEGYCSDSDEWLKTGNYWSFEACDVDKAN